MKHQTTLEHFEKYEKFCRITYLANSVPLRKTFMCLTREQMFEEYQRDPHLNTIDLDAWDREARRLGSEFMSLAERVCTLKHAAIFYFLSMSADFTLSNTAHN